MDKQVVVVESSGRACAKQFSGDNISFFVYSSNTCLSKTYQNDNLPQQCLIYETAQLLYEFLQGEKSDIFSIDGNYLCFVDIIARKKREFRIPLDLTRMNRESTVKIQLQRINYRLKQLLQTSIQKEEELAEMDCLINIKAVQNQTIKLKLQNLYTAYNELLRTAEEQLSEDLKSDNYLREQRYANDCLKKRMQQRAMKE